MHEMRNFNMQWNTRLKMLPVLFVLIMSVTINTDAQIQVYDSDHRRVEVLFNSTHTQKDLEQFQKTLFEYGIMLTYDALVFDKKGRLERIEFSVDCKDGFAGDAKIEGLKKNSRYGFFRDYAADATNSQPPFGVGDLDVIGSMEK